MTSVNSLNSLKTALMDVAKKNEERHQSFWGCFSSRHVVVKTQDGSFEATKACWFYYSNGKKLATEKDLRQILNRTLFEQLTADEKIEVTSGLKYMKCHEIADQFLDLEPKKQQESKKQQEPTTVIEQNPDGRQEEGNTTQNISYILGINPADLPPVGYSDPNFPVDIYHELERKAKAKQNTVPRLKQDADGWQEYRFPTESRTTAQNISYIQGINLDELPPVGYSAPNFPADIYRELEREAKAKQNSTSVSPSRVQSDSPTTTVASESSSSRESSPQVVRKVTGQSAYRGKLEAQFGVHFLDEVQFSTKKSTIKLSNLEEADRRAIITYIQRSYLVDPNNQSRGYKGGNSCPPTVYLQDETILVMNSGFSDGAVKRELTLTYDTMVRILELKQVKSCAHLYNSPLFQRMKAANAQ